MMIDQLLKFLRLVEVRPVNVFLVADRIYGQTVGQSEGILSKRLSRQDFRKRRVSKTVSMGSIVVFILGWFLRNHEIGEHSIILGRLKANQDSV